VLNIGAMQVPGWADASGGSIFATIAGTAVFPSLGGFGGYGDEVRASTQRSVSVIPLSLEKSQALGAPRLAMEDLKSSIIVRR
jgi:hypothetical protein